MSGHTSDDASQPIQFQPIGRVANNFNETVAPDLIRAENSQIILDPALVQGLTGLEPGQRILVLFHFHLADGFSLMQHPRGDRSQPARGIFALRTPNRPVPIGVTTVDLLAIANNILHVAGLDAINGTPVLDIKPA